MWGTPRTSAFRRVAALFLVAAAVLFATTGSVAGVTSAPSADAAARIEHWQNDLDQLATGLAHHEISDAYAPAQTRFEQEIAALRAEVATASDDQLTVGVMQAVATFGVAHTSASPPSWWSRNYPLTLWHFDDGFHVVGAAPQYAAVLGAVVTKIGDTPIADAVQRIAAISAHENMPGLIYSAQGCLVSATVLHALGILAPGRDDFTFRTADGRFSTLTLAADFPGQHSDQQSVRTTVPLYAQQPDKFFWFDYLADSRTLYVRYAACNDAPAFAAMTTDVFATAAREPVARLVVDVRGNPGGDTAGFDPFLEALRNSPLARPDRLFALIDRATFSSGMLTAINLVNQAHATTAGEAVGEKPNSYGDIGTFTLPYSNITIAYATRYIRTTAGDPPTLAPDMPVDTSYAAYARGDDPVLDTVLGVKPAS